MTRKKILVVHNEVYILHILDFALGMEDFDVVTALNAEQALKAVDENNIDLAVIEVNLLPTDGYELCSILKVNPKTQNMPIIMIVPIGRPIPRQMAFEAGADECVDKPFSPRKLVDVVKSTLRSSPTSS